MEELHIRLLDTQDQLKVVLPPKLTAAEVKRVATEVYGFRTVSEYLRSLLQYGIEKKPVLDHAPKEIERV